MDELRAELDAYRNALDFDLTSPVPVLGRPLTSIKRAIRRIFRFYIARQSAHNEYSLSLSAALHDEHRRLAQDLDSRITRLERRIDLLERALASLPDGVWISEVDESSDTESERAEERNVPR